MQMKVRTGVGFVLSALALVLFVWLGATTASAAPEDALTDEQKTHIRSECSQIKGSLNQLHASDALLRVNRGQAYESISSKMMLPFNARLGAASFDNKAMETHASQYAGVLSDFRTSYILYEQKLASVLKVDCQQKPQEFYTGILEARELRKAVHEDVNRLHQVMTDYGTSVGDFLENYKRLGK